jgi:iron complex outermembrane receptor protein
MKAFASTAVCALSTALSVGFAPSAHAQTRPASPAATTISDVVVTARRREERLQDVPISMTVYNQQALSNRNIISIGDLATYTPSLSSDMRFGPDRAAFSIRGFTRELRTTASVATYFADVVAQRAPAGVNMGDGAGPGSFFDLQNAQVLKGPQGTLFGRNTTGGAILLVPNRPTREFEGYVQASGGSHGMYGVQAVLNVPINDQVRARFGIDQEKRDGYLHNTSGIGPKDFSDIGYVAARASVIVDLTPDLENYTILTYSKSNNHGILQSLFACNPNPPTFFGQILHPYCSGQLGGVNELPRSKFYDVQNPIPDPYQRTVQAQIINTTTWHASDALTVKNILSYGRFKAKGNSAFFGLNFPVHAGADTFPLVITSVGGTLADQRNFVEELQLQGKALDSRLTWQGGFYYEHSTPGGHDYTYTSSVIGCNYATLSGPPSGYRCNDYVSAAVFGGAFPIGDVNPTTNEVNYLNRAIYAQATYDITHQLSITGGIRYTWDKTRGVSTQTFYYFPGSTTGANFSAPIGSACFSSTAVPPLCETRAQQVSKAPTWLIDLDYKPTSDVLLYAKYARGYRQGSVNLLSDAPFQTYRPEHVDVYEAGAKTKFDWPVSTIFNISVFYNKLHDQQLQASITSATGSQTTAILNAGASRMYGVELEADMELFEGFTLSANYAYLNTKLLELTVPNVPGLLVPPQPTSAIGEPLPFTPKNKGGFTATYRLPVPESVGDLEVAATYAYVGSQQATARAQTPFAVMPSYSLVNFNVNWNRIGGSRVDGAFFVTNAFGEKYTTDAIGLWQGLGFETRNVGEPRMVGMRLRYNFGASH